MADVFFRQPSGDPGETWVAGRISVHGDDATIPDDALPGDAQVITADQYQAMLAAQASERDAELAGIAVAAQARVRDQYDTLVAGGISPAAASIITGYTPEEA